MFEWLLGERALDAILALVVIEAFVVVGWRLTTGRGPAPRAFLTTLLSGAFILLAMRGAIAGTSPKWIALSLIAAFIAHIADLRGRWRGEMPATVRDPNSARMRATIALRVPSSRPAPDAQHIESSHA